MALMCYRHSKVEAVTNCTNCRQPICPVCIVKRDGMIYCSDACATTYKKTAAKVVNKLEKLRYGSGFFGTIIKTAIVIGIIYFVARYFGYAPF